MADGAVAAKLLYRRGAKTQRLRRELLSSAVKGLYGKEKAPG